jgi:hypothetical protein
MVVRISSSLINSPYPWYGTLNYTGGTVALAVHSVTVANGIVHFNRLSFVLTLIFDYQCRLFSTDASSKTQERPNRPTAYGRNSNQPKHLCEY